MPNFLFRNVLPDFLRQIKDNVTGDVFLPASSARDGLVLHETALLLDTSESMQKTDLTPNRLKTAQDGGMELVREYMLSPNQCRFAIVGFSAKAIVAHSFADGVDILKLEAAIKSLTPAGQTFIGVGLEAVEREFSRSLKTSIKRKLILLSDGGENGPVDPIKVAMRLKRMGCSIYTRGIGGDNNAVDEDLLKSIASCDESGVPQYMFHRTRAALIRDFGGLTK